MNSDRFKAMHTVDCFMIGSNILPERYGSFRSAVIIYCKQRGWMRGW